VVISYAVGDAKPITLYHDSDPTSLASEGWLLDAFLRDMRNLPMADHLNLLWVGHNVCDFDLRFIFQRAVIHGKRPPHHIPFGHRSGYRDSRVYDTMIEWCGTRDRVGLDKLCRVLGISGKGSEIGDEIDGSKVWEFVQAGRIADVATYCGGDVERVREVYRRMTFNRGDF
jgi:hypothetical protein